LPVADVLMLLSRIREAPVIVLSAPCRAKILEHLRTRDTELGGLLMGWPYMPDHGVPPTWCPVVSIEHVLPSRVCESSGVSLAMSTEVWDRARDATFRGKGMVVGWYHSHPNLGAFFSGTDRSTQRSFFAHAYSVGLVIDPVRHEDAWFMGADATRLDPRAVLTHRRMRNAGVDRRRSPGQRG
jgi:proteasome lid subunit RPN8/RPN11